MAHGAGTHRPAERADDHQLGQNYSTPLLPSADGAQILLMQTDGTAEGGCAARFGRGRLSP